MKGRRGEPAGAACRTDRFALFVLKKLRKLDARERQERLSWKKDSLKSGDEGPCRWFSRQSHALDLGVSHTYNYPKY